MRVQGGVADAAPEAVRMPRAAGHLEDVAVRDEVAAEAALAALGLKGDLEKINR